MQATEPLFGVYQFNGLPNNPWNGMVIYTVTTPKGDVLELLGRFRWTQEQFNEEQKKGLWDKLPTEDYLEFDCEGKAIIHSVKQERG